MRVILKRPVVEINGENSPFANYMYPNMDDCTI